MPWLAGSRVQEGWFFATDEIGVVTGAGERSGVAARNQGNLQNYSFLAQYLPYSSRKVMLSNDVIWSKNSTPSK